MQKKALFQDRNLTKTTTKTKTKTSRRTRKGKRKRTRTRVQGGPIFGLVFTIYDYGGCLRCVRITKGVRIVEASCLVL